MLSYVLFSIYFIKKILNADIFTIVYPNIRNKYNFNKNTF